MAPAPGVELTSSVGVSTMRSIITVAAGVAMIVGLAVLIWRAATASGVANHSGSVRGSLGLARRRRRITLVLTAAHGLLAPYPAVVRPRRLGLLLLVVPSVLDGILLARLTLIAVACAGRVIGMTPGVEALTLGCGVR